MRQWEDGGDGWTDWSRLGVFSLKKWKNYIVVSCLLYLIFLFFVEIYIFFVFLIWNEGFFTFISTVFKMFRKGMTSFSFKSLQSLT